MVVVRCGLVAYNRLKEVIVTVAEWSIAADCKSAPNSTLVRIQVVAPNFIYKGFKDGL